MRGKTDDIHRFGMLDTHFHSHFLYI